MRFVLVPVPAEHVLEIMRWVLFRAPDDDIGAEKKNDDRLAVWLRGADPQTTALLQLIADASVEDRPLRLNDAADELDLDGAAVQAMLRAVNATFVSRGRPLVRVAAETAVGVHSNKGKVSFLSMRPEDARIVRATLRPADAAGG